MPQIGVEAAVASVYAVTTQERCSRPPSSPTIVGIAVPMIMLSSIASSMAIMSASSTTRTLRGWGPSFSAPPLTSFFVSASIAVLHSPGAPCTYLPTG